MIKQVLNIEKLHRIELTPIHYIKRIKKLKYSSLKTNKIYCLK